MTSVWGQSWGQSWGDAWGSVEELTRIAHMIIIPGRITENLTFKALIKTQITSKGLIT